MNSRSIHYPPAFIENLDECATNSFFHFLQQMANRRAVGALRYGDIPQRKKKYMDRLEIELEEYRKTGNHEQLLNIAVYAFLESYAPQNGKYHFNPAVDSVTRGTMG